MLTHCNGDTRRKCRKKTSLRLWFLGTSNPQTRLQPLIHRVSAFSYPDGSLAQPSGLANCRRSGTLPRAIRQCL